MPVDSACFKQCYTLCLLTLTEEAGPLSIALCAMACYWACGGGAEVAGNTQPGSDTQTAQADDATVVADNGQDPNPATPPTPESTGELSPEDPGEDTGSIGNAPVDGSSGDTYGSDFGGTGGSSEGGDNSGDDGGPNEDTPQQ
jgi:hypothetical protein